MFIGIILLIFVNRKENSHPYIAVIRCSGQESEKKAMECLQKNAKKCAVKSKTVMKNGVELTVEIRLKEDNTDFVNEIADLKGVESAVLVSYNGNYMG